MKLDIITPDPLRVLTTTKSIVEKAHYVSINQSAITELAKLVKEKIENGLPSGDQTFAVTGDQETDFQLVFIEDAVNFCFWEEKGKDKWSVQEPVNEAPKSGFYGLLACFRRARAENVPILDPGYLEQMTLKDAQRFFRSANSSEIPLLKERWKNLREAGKELNSKFNGHFKNLVEAAGGDAIKIVKLVCEYFPSFRDITVFEGNEIVFLKRAQILANDTAYPLGYKKHETIRNLDQLTAFADYKLPQVFREYGVFKYSPKLIEKIDNYILISAGSREEVEIRSATIWAVELIRQHLKTYAANEIDNAIWFISQDLPGDAKPYHRTYTIFY